MADVSCCHQDEGCGWSLTGAATCCAVLCCAVACCAAQEAGYCCRGTDGCNAVMRLTVQDELWAAVNRGDGAVVRQHLTPLRLTPTQVRVY
jgi:hypothetical protein